MLERHARKPARAVLRGGGGGDATSLPDQPTGAATSASRGIQSRQAAPAAELSRSRAPANPGPGRGSLDTHDHRIRTDQVFHTGLLESGLLQSWRSSRSPARLKSAFTPAIGAWDFNNTSSQPFGKTHSRPYLAPTSSSFC